MFRKLGILGLIFALAVGISPAFAATGPACLQLPNHACISGTTSQTITVNWTMGTGQTFTASNLGVNYTASASNPTCSAGNYIIYADSGTSKLKKCENGTVSDVGSGAGAVSWSSITAPTANLSLAMSTNYTTFTWPTGTTTNNLFTLQDTTANTGTGHILAVNSVGTSTMKPLIVTAQGTANGIEMSSAGALSAIGTGTIVATSVASAGFTSGLTSHFNFMTCSAGPTCTLATTPISADAVTVWWRGVISRRVAACGGINEHTISGTTLTPCDLTGVGTGADSFQISWWS